MTNDSQRIHAIDLLRIVAAFAVLSHHWNWPLRASFEALPGYPAILARHGGFFGVSLFFLISGFVILKSAQGISARAFIANRAIRLYPAFWVCCTITWIISWADSSGRSFGEYVLNLSMFPEAFGVHPVDGVYWTLAVEAKFYGLIAVVIALGCVHRIEAVLWAWLVLAKVLDDPFTSRMLMAEQAPFFIGGCACLILSERQTLSRWALFCSAAACGLVEALTQAAQIARLFKTAPVSSVTVIIVLLLFLVVLASAMGWVRLRRSRVLAAAGATSYPLYLLHAEIGYAIFGRFREAIPLGVLAPLALAGVTALGWAISRWVEPAGQHLLRRFVGMRRAPIVA
jgi:peptidoglycan/LPS O-acetylase OafA/YrhL